MWAISHRRASDAAGGIEPLHPALARAASAAGSLVNPHAHSYTHGLLLTRVKIKRGATMSCVPTWVSDSSWN
jgi:hypothetical protein